MLIDVGLPELRDLRRQQYYGRRTLNGDDIDPLDVGVIIGACAIRQCGDVVFDIAGLVVVFIFVGQAVEAAEELAEQAAPDFVLDGFEGHFNKLVRVAGCGCGTIVCGEGLR